jgi:hypothetical protein
VGLGGILCQGIIVLRKRREYKRLVKVSKKVGGFSTSPLFCQYVKKPSCQPADTSEKVRELIKHLANVYTVKKGRDSEKK